MGSGVPHAPGLTLAVHTLRRQRRAGGRARGATRPPGGEQRGPGPRPPPATPIASHEAAPRAPPPPRAARNGGRATKWQPGWPRRGDPRRLEATSPRADGVPSHAVHELARVCASHPREPPECRRGCQSTHGSGAKEDGVRGPLSQRLLCHFGAPRPGGFASIFPVSPPFRVSRSAPCPHASSWMDVCRRSWARLRPCTFCWDFSLSSLRKRLAFHSSP